jgi:hypothetical protein
MGGLNETAPTRACINRGNDKFKSKTAIDIDWNNLVQVMKTLIEFPYNLEDAPEKSKIFHK